MKVAIFHVDSEEILHWQYPVHQHNSHCVCCGLPDINITDKYNKIKTHDSESRGQEEAQQRDH